MSYVFVRGVAGVHVPVQQLSVEAAQGVPAGAGADGEGDGDDQGDRRRAWPQVEPRGEGEE